MTLRVIAGGQTGVDRAALDAAVELGLPYGGWCPAGGWAEDLPEPPGVLAAYPHLQPTPGTDPSLRTTWNVRDSDATLVLVLDSVGDSSGTRLALDEADRLARPSLVARTQESARVLVWLRHLDPDGILNVAGPRESEQPGVYDEARATLLTVLSAAGPAPRRSGYGRGHE